MQYQMLVGLPSSNRLPITDSLVLVIWRSLDLYALGCVHFGYFGFVCAAEFTVPNLASFLPLIHLTVQNIGVDAPFSPLCMCIIIKTSKTDPFCKGCDIHISLGCHPLFAVQAVMAYISQRGSSPGICFAFRMVNCFLMAFSLIG